MSFIHDDFLLQGRTARELYHCYAEDMPIHDYHCHLPIRQIAEDHQFADAAEIWLGGDHYKWRVMRTFGIDEQEITGAADGHMKFTRWAEALSYAIGNPVYHWSHLELKRYFGIDILLGADTADEIWQEMNRQLCSEDFRARRLIERSGVRFLSTTDDPADSLEYHDLTAAVEDFPVTVTPSFRPDKALKIEQEEFLPYIETLGRSCRKSIETLDDLLDSLVLRIEAFHAAGCRISDHSLERVSYQSSTYEEAKRAFEQRKKGLVCDSRAYSSFLMNFLGKEYSRRSWCMQLHIGAMRNTNTRMLKLLGPDIGCDAIDDGEVAAPLARMLDDLEREDSLPKTILYCLNPRDNELLGALTGCFQKGPSASKLQFGAAWWFNDQYDGMIEQLKTLGRLGMLSGFVGMLTDSRSMLSYPRHEYFRRVLCDLFGSWMDRGLYPRDMQQVGRIVRDICYTNACSYLNIPEKGKRL